MFDITPRIKIVSNQGDGERDARIDPCQSAFHPDNLASPLPSHLISLNDPMASETVRPLPTFMSDYIYGIWRLLQIDIPTLGPMAFMGRI